MVLMGLLLLFILSMIMATLLVVLLHIFLFIYICIYGPHTLRVVIVTLHIVWILLCLRNGQFYGYNKIFKSTPPTMNDRGIASIGSWAIYHSGGNGKRNEGTFRNSMDNARGPLVLSVWGEKKVEEEFPTERWALQRLYQTLEMDKSLSYEEMFILYKQKWGDRVGFRIGVTEYEHHQEIKEK